MPFWSKKNNPPSNKLGTLNRLARGAGPVEILGSLPTGSPPVPVEWANLFSMDRRQRISAVLSLWQRTCAELMPNTIAYLGSHLQDVEIIRLGPSIRLLYSITNRLGEAVYCLGGNPRQMTLPATGSLDISRVPESIRVFHQELHDGFYNFGTAVGLDPLVDVFCLGDEDWGVIDRLSVDIPINLTTTYSFFSTGAGGHVVVDLNDCADDKAAVWWATSAPTFDQNFWAVVDEWTVISLEPAG